ncbi:MAG: DUF1700 domain-containing protein [Lachnospiraceae bacterium]|nr:DUF1700 domain-containing protein [Lachnospiraceae bacterium]
MNRSEFLQQLREALENDLSGSVVQENIDYYNNYIAEEVRMGRSESIIIEELGDPWILARTVIESLGGSNQGFAYEEEVSYSAGRRSGQQGTMHTVGLDKWWKKVLAVLIVVLVLVAVVSIVMGVVSLVAPVLLPVLLVIIVFRILSRKRQ